MTRHQKCDKVRACVHAQVMCIFARVHVHVIVLVVDEVCLMLVLSAHVVLVAVCISFP